MQPTATSSPDGSRPAGTISQAPTRRRRRRARVAGAFAWAAALVAITGGSAAAWPEGGSPKPPAVTPPPQLRQLDFLLGDLRCLYDSGTTLRSRNTTILGGTYLQMNMHAEKALGNRTINGRWILGWDQHRSQFSTYYYDDNLNQGTSTSPGWQNGEFTLIGSYVLAEVPVPITVKDVFKPITANHFTIVESAEVNGAWQVLNTQDCVRSRHK
jgi:hypothetical protein